MLVTRVDQQLPEFSGSSVWASANVFFTALILIVLSIITGYLQQQNADKKQQGVNVGEMSIDVLIAMTVTYAACLFMFSETSVTVF